MKLGNKKAVKIRQTRALRVRSNLRGTAECPRMCVVKTNKHIYVQLIDDLVGHTLACESTFSKDFRSKNNSKSKESAVLLGEVIAQKANSLGIKKVIFDRGSFAYHGILASLADAARQNGLQF